MLALNYRDGLLHTSEQSRFTARVLAESLQDFVETLVTWMRGQYEFDPAVAELEFGFSPGGAPAWEIDLGAGHKLALRGRIDRIDLCRETDGRALCVVMDYKSGQKKLDKILVEHGVQLQLLAYLAAIRSWPPEIWAGLNLPAYFSPAPAQPINPWERRRPAGQSEAKNRNSPARRQRSQELRPGSGIQSSNSFGKYLPPGFFT